MTGNKKTISRHLLPFALLVIIVVVVIPCAEGASAGNLSVDTVPSGASLYIDGKLAGTTPFTSGSIASGDHALVFRLDGYEDLQVTITVPAGGNAEGTYTMVPASKVTTIVTTATSQAATGSLTITSTPSGASVSIDETVKGTTPFTAKAIAAGDHLVTLTMEGYGDLSSTITVPAGGEASNQFTLACNVLSVDSIPSGATLSIDGVQKGTTPLVIRAIPAGGHTVTLKKTGYKDYTTTENVQSGAEIDLVATMVSIQASTATTAVEETTEVPVVTTASLPQACTMQFAGSGELATTADGRLNCTVIISSEDQRSTLTIAKGTLVTGADKHPVATIWVSPVPSSAAPEGWRWTGRAYRFIPDGTSFSPAVVVSFTLSQDEWNTWGPQNLTIKETGRYEQSWEDLPVTLDPATRTLHAKAGHFSTIGLFLPAPALSTATTTVPAPATVVASVPAKPSPLMPAKLAPVAAVVTGVAISVAGSFAAGNTVLSRIWGKITALLRNFTGSESAGMMNVIEIEKRGIRPAENLSAVLLGISSREFLVIAISTLGFAAAFILQDHLAIVLTTVLIFVCAGGIATILHDLGHKYCAYRAGCITEYQFWGLGAVTMLLTAWLFGNAFAKPSRTLIRGGNEPSPEVAALIRLAGPLVSMAVATVSLFLIPLGGLFALAGTAGFSMNLLNAVFSLVPVKPNDGVEVWAWNRLVWATVFIPLFALYLSIYLLT